MNCGYGEKLVLYFYGEADARVRAEVESHLPGCPSCRGELAALRAAGGWLGRAEPPARAVAAVMAAARVAARGASGFRFGWRELLAGGALAAALAGVFAFSGRGAGAELAWNSGLDSRLDSVEENLYQVRSEMNAGSGDWDYNYSSLEDESSRAGESV